MRIAYRLQEMICKEKPIEAVLRLMCLVSLTQVGLDGLYVSSAIHSCVPFVLYDMTASHGMDFLKGKLWVQALVRLVIIASTSTEFSLFVNLQGGIPKKLHDAMYRDILHTYGHQHMLSLQLLQSAGQSSLPESQLTFSSTMLIRLLPSFICQHITRIPPGF